MAIPGSSAERQELQIEINIDVKPRVKLTVGVSELYSWGVSVEEWKKLSMADF